MARRAIWKGYLHFGGIDVPVKLHTTVREQRIQFHLLHKRDGIRLKQQMVCAYEQVPVSSEEQVRGYQIEEGRYVLIRNDELDMLDPENNRMIEVHEFVKSREIDPIYYDRAYYLEPDIKNGIFRMLMNALRELDIGGICTWTMRKRTYIGALQAFNTSLRLNSIHYADEIISTSSLDLTDTAVSQKEREIGIQLINQMSGSFRPEEFTNEHQKKLQDLIDRKTRGEKITILRPKRVKTTAPDTLLETLKAGLKRVA